MKKLLFHLIWAILCVEGFCSTMDKPDYIIDDKRLILQAQDVFDEEDFGRSLKLVELAKESRRNKCDWEVFTLENSFKPREVKREGDIIEDVIPVLKEREDFDALFILERYGKILGYDRFNHSCTKLIDFIRASKGFPEALYLEGRIYTLEGEYEVAEKCYKEALSNSSLLYVPQERYDILYSLVDLNYTMKDFECYEKNLLLIVSQDEMIKDKTLLRAMNYNMQNHKAGSLEKFFVMFRPHNYLYIKAYFMLSDFYASRGEKEKCLNMSALGVLTSYSKIVETLKKRDPEFEYESLTITLNQCQNYRDLLDWGDSNGVWKGFNEFGKYAIEKDYKKFGYELLCILQDYSPTGYYRKEAELMLKG